MKLEHLSDEELVAQLSRLHMEGHALTARVLVSLIEVEERRLHLTAACSSLFDFCVRRLGMAEGFAFRRITAARVVRQFPQLLGLIETGRLHLSTVVQLRPHLTEGNVDELVGEAMGKSRAEVDLILARRAPKPDVPDRIEPLGGAGAVGASSAGGAASGGQTLLPGAAVASTPGAPAHVRARVDALSEGRFRVQLTASEELRAKLERARDLMSHRNPSMELAVVVEAGLDLLLAKLEKEVLGQTKPRAKSKKMTCKKTATSAPASAAGSAGSESGSRSGSSDGEIDAAAKREAFARDGAQCTFTDAEGHRCPARAFLELDHRKPRARRGPGHPDNLRVLCRAHNLLHAEQVFGKEHVTEQIHLRQRTSHRIIANTPASWLDPETRARATSGLLGLGFSKAEVERALTLVAGRSHRLPIEELLREAIGVLT